MIVPNTIATTPVTRKRLVVIGNGMAGARLVSRLYNRFAAHRARP